MALGTEKKLPPNIIVSKDGRSMVKRGSASDPSSDAARKKLAAKRIAAARSGITGDLKKRVIASQEASVKRGGVQRQANPKTGDKGELSVQPKTKAPNAFQNETTDRGLRKLKTRKKTGQEISDQL
jgi:hypothetical protein